MENIPSKEIIALSDFEHVLTRPTMYIGSLEAQDIKVRVIKNDNIEDVTKPVSEGFYKLMNEILDNAFDEAKRLNGKMEKITIEFCSKTKRVTVTDTGHGFHKGTEINAKTGVNNIETAMSMLRAGSNFKNDNIDNTLIGTNGVGASVVNMLSDEFEVHSINTIYNYRQVWKQFVTETREELKKQRSDISGTKISFIPRKDKFKKCNWDFDYIESQMIFKEYIRKNDPILQNVGFEVFCDGRKLDLNKNFIPTESYVIQSKIGTFILWEHRENGTKSTSFINTALCSGAHERIMTDKLNDIFDYKWAHQYYDFFFIMNLPPKLVRFGDQNKTKYALGRWEIEPTIEKNFFKELTRSFHKTDIFKRIKTRIKEASDNDEIKGLKRALKTKSKKIISDKYIAPSDRKGSLFICEGQSAIGSLAQKRNSATDGLYALKGKIKNCRTVADLTKNAEIVDLINILDLEIGKTYCGFDKIYLAVDADPDGLGHIASLLIQFFHKWFPFVIEQRKLFILITPLVSADVGKQRKYFYSLNEFAEYEKTSTEKYSNVRYLKGLGSLSVQDWEVIMFNRDCFMIYADRSADKYLEIAFSENAKLRKNFLSGAL